MIKLIVVDESKIKRKLLNLVHFINDYKRQTGFKLENEPDMNIEEIINECKVDCRISITTNIE